MHYASEWTIQLQNQAIGDQIQPQKFSQNAIDQNLALEATKLILLGNVPKVSKVFYAQIANQDILKLV